MAETTFPQGVLNIVLNSIVDMGIQRQDMRAASKIPQPKTGTDSKVIQSDQS